MRNLYLVLFVLFFVHAKAFSQNTITVSGPAPVNPGDQATYYTLFNYVNGPITWSVIGGVIVSPPSSNSCTIWWDWTNGKGSVTAYDANNNVTGKLIVFRGQQELEFECIIANAGNDVSICSGGSATIGTPTIPGFTYSWSPTTGLSNPNIAQPIANPLATTNYTLTVATQNLLQNGDFELGNAGFTSGYLLHPNALYDNFYGRYAVTTNPTLIHGWCNMTDHSPNGTLMFVADGNSNPFNNPPAWSETVTVTPNTDYDFSGFVFKLYPQGADPVIQVRINNTIVLSNLIPANTTCGAAVPWTSFNIPTWNSGSSTTAIIEIRTTSWAEGGNDFALDDLKFNVHCLQTTDQVTVGVSNQIPSVTPAGPITYYNQYESPQQVVLTSTPAGGYQWYKNNVAIPGANSQTYTVTLDGFGVSTDYYKCANACGTSNTVTLNYNGCNSSNYTTCYPVAIPWGPSCASTIISQGLQLPALPSLGGGTFHQWWPYSTSSCFNISSTGFLTQTSGFGTWCVDGIYTKASRNGVETYMYYVFGSNPGCRTMNTGNDPNQAFINGNTQKQKASLFPSPATTQITITAPGGIDMIEIYNELGVLMRKQKNNGSDKLVLSTATLANGVYVCRITGKNGQETIRFLVRRQ